MHHKFVGLTTAAATVFEAIVNRDSVGREVVSLMRSMSLERSDGAYNEWVGVDEKWQSTLELQRADGPRVLRRGDLSVILQSTSHHHAHHV